MTIKLRHELEIEHFAERVTKLFAEEIQRANRNCVVCENFDKRSETCNLNKLRPPAAIIAYGCEMFLEEIPF